MKTFLLIIGGAAVVVIMFFFNVGMTFADYVDAELRDWLYRRKNKK
jgi:hypothetical protein